MPGIFARIYVKNVLDLVVLLVLWIVLYACARVVLMLLRGEPLIGWAVGPFGITIMFLHDPSLLSIWLNVLCPAVVSGGVLYVGLFTRLSPLTLPDNHLIQFLLLVFGIVISSTVDFIRALQDVRHPLWGEARVLRNIQILRASWASIHFTPFGRTYLLDHFGSNSTDLLSAL